MYSSLLPLKTPAKLLEKDLSSDGTFLILQFSEYASALKILVDIKVVVKNKININFILLIIYNNVIVLCFILYKWKS